MIYLTRESILFLFAIAGIFHPSILNSQERPSELIIEEFSIIGRDTSVYTPEGEMISTVRSTTYNLELSEIEIGRDASSGLISQENRMWRLEPPKPPRQRLLMGEMVVGSRSMTGFNGKGFSDSEDQGLAVEFTSQMRRENTPLNESPSFHMLNLAAFSTKGKTFYHGETSFSMESDTAGNRSFRGFDRDAMHYNIAVSANRSVFDNWNLYGKVSMNGGTFKDHDLDYSRTENVFKARTKLSGEVGTVSTDISADAGVIGYGGDATSYLRLGGSGKTLLLDHINVDAGLTLNIWDSPVEGTTVKVFPVIKSVWMMDRSLSVHLNADPSMRVYSYGDIYRLNGLALPTRAVFEKDIRAFSGEFDWKLMHGFHLRTGLHHRKTADALVFTPSADGEKFEAIRDFTKEVNSFKTSIYYHDTYEQSSFNAELVVNSAKNQVPFLPFGELGAEGYIKLHRDWKIKGSFRFLGYRHIDTDTDSKSHSFALFNAGAEYSLPYGVTASLELRNITNSKGGWWTERYRIPGIGLYVGVNAKY